MNLFRASAIFTAVLIGASFLPWIDAAHAQRRRFEASPAQDGVYAVDITTLEGDCDSAYHWTVSVSGGHVTAAVDTPIEASSQINRRGIVDAGGAGRRSTVNLIYNCCGCFGPVG